VLHLGVESAFLSDNKQRYIANSALLDETVLFFCFRVQITNAIV
jgi:hypothetical protein